VNKHIAHSSDTTTARPPTPEQVAKAYDVFDELVQRYDLLVDGRGLTSTTPTLPFDFLEPLTVPWVRPGDGEPSGGIVG
jgi:hypothetical protein